MNEIIVDHITQTLDNNCTSACLAMVTGLPIDKITEEFHKRYCEGTLEPYEYLRSLGCNFERVLGGCRDLDFNNIYIASVPSLNIDAGMHHVVFQINRDMTWNILDPNFGKEGRLIYVSGEEIAKEDENWRTIKSWNLDYKISFDEVKRLYKVNRKKIMEQLKNVRTND